MDHRRIYLSEDGKAFMDTYLWKKPNPRSPQWTPETRPLVVVLPGGGYMYCSEREGEPVALSLFTRGFHTVVLNYHCGEESEYPLPLVDLAKGIRYLKEHREELLLDGDRIALLGFSAGGHLAALYASLWFREEFQEALGMKGEDLAVQALLCGYPVANLRSFCRRVGSDPEMPELGRMITSYDEKKDPMALIHKEMPPTFIFATGEDKIIPEEETLAYARALAREGVDLEYHLFSRGPHGLATGNALTNHSRDYPEGVDRWIPMADTWLKHILNYEF